MHVGLLELTAEALRKVVDAHGDGHLVDPPDRSLDDALADAGAKIDDALRHLRGALVAVQPALKRTSRPCACEACETAAMEVDTAIRALREPLP